ncbi:MAG: MotA/TolQ/ExbB proton channel family protein [Bacteroidales bacterium]|jgi:biopolymer transport protein ExbB
MLLQIVQQPGIISDTIQQGLSSLPQVNAPTHVSLSLWDLALKGGVIVLILALLSLWAIYIFIERYIAINKAAKQDENFMNNIRDFVHNSRLDSALSYCKNNDTTISRMIEKGLSRLGRPLGDIRAAIENVGTLEVGRLEKNVSILAMIAGGSPMLGFLGTVTGMVRAFYDMSMAGNNINIQLLSTGIYQALVTTVAGLIVGLLAYFCYNILVSRIQKVVNNLENRTTEFMDLLHEPAKK